ncbi:MAG: CBS domain-containing protein [Anaerolineaceae bacterium]|nr:CBS domain-containing protein [Anaerolineaceae bacterium]
MLTVADIMTSSPITVGRNTPLGEIIGMMKSYACRQLPVVDEGRLIGIITDRDVRLAMNSPLTMREHAQDQALLSSVTAEACMTANPMTIESTAPATHAANLMNMYKFGALPVVDDGKLVGIVATADILSSYIKLLGEKEQA